MSISSEISRINGNIADAYDAVDGKGGTLPSVQNSANLPAAIESITPAKPEQAKTLTLGAETPSTVTPDSGKVLSSVPVVLDTSVIKAENIAKDVTMLGVTGTHEGGGYEPGQVEFGSGPTIMVSNGAYRLSDLKRIYGYDDIRGATIYNADFQSILLPESGDTAFFENYTNGELDGVTFSDWSFEDRSGRALVKNVNAKIKFEYCTFDMDQPLFMIEHSFVDLVLKDCSFY